MPTEENEMVEDISSLDPFQDESEPMEPKEDVSVVDSVPSLDPFDDGDDELPNGGFTASVTAGAKISPDDASMSIVASKSLGVSGDFQKETNELIKEQYHRDEIEKVDIPHGAPITARWVEKDPKNAALLKENPRRFKDAEQSINEVIKSRSIWESYWDVYRYGVVNIAKMASSVPAFLYMGATNPRTWYPFMPPVMDAAGIPNISADPRTAFGGAIDLIGNPITTYLDKLGTSLMPPELESSALDVISSDPLLAGRILMIKAAASAPQMVGSIVAAKFGVGPQYLAGIGALTGADEAAQQLEDGVSPGNAFSVGAIVGTIESVAEKFGTQAITEKLIKRYGVEKAVGFWRGFLADTVLSFNQEGLEEALTDVGQSATRYLFGDTNAFDGIWDRIAESYMVGGLASATTSVPGSVLTGIAKRKNRNKMTPYELLGEEVKATIPSGKNISAYSDWIRGQVQGAKAETAYINETAFRKHFQTDGQDPDAVIQDLGATVERGVIQVDTATWIEKQLNKPAFEALRDDITLDGKLTPRENKELKEILRKEAAEKAEDERLSSMTNDEALQDLLDKLPPDQKNIVRFISPQTGTLNERALVYAKPPADKPMYAFIKPAGMKFVNDNYSYEHGDDVLRHAGSAIRAVFPGVYKYGSGFVLVGVKDQAEADSIAAKANSILSGKSLRIGGKTTISGRSIPIRASVGTSKERAKDAYQERKRGRKRGVAPESYQELGGVGEAPSSETATIPQDLENQAILANDVLGSYFKDPDTGLYDARAYKRLSKVLKHTSLMDFNKYGDYVSEAGTKQGDEVTSGFARTVGGVIDFVKAQHPGVELVPFRLGGDEFGLLSNDRAAVELFHEELDNFISKTSNEFKKPDGAIIKYKVELSVGLGEGHEQANWAAKEAKRRSKLGTKNATAHVRGLGVGGFEIRPGAEGEDVAGGRDSGRRYGHSYFISGYRRGEDTEGGVQLSDAETERKRLSALRSLENWKKTPIGYLSTRKPPIRIHFDLPAAITPGRWRKRSELAEQRTRLSELGARTANNPQLNSMSVPSVALLLYNEYKNGNLHPHPFLESLKSKTNDGTKAPDSVEFEDFYEYFRDFRGENQYKFATYGVRDGNIAQRVGEKTPDGAVQEQTDEERILSAISNAQQETATESIAEDAGSSARVAAVREAVKKFKKETESAKKELMTDDYKELVDEIYNRVKREDEAISRVFKARDILKENKDANKIFVADILGFETPEDMDRAVGNIGKTEKELREYAEAQAATAMPDVYNPNNPNDVKWMAIEAQLNDKAMRVFHKQLHEIQRRIYQKSEIDPGLVETLPTLGDIRDKARTNLGALTFSAVKPDSFLSQAFRCGSLVKTHMGRGEFHKALTEKANHIFYLEMVRGARDLIRTRQKARSLFSTINKKSKEVIGKTRDFDYVDAARLVLSKFGLGPKSERGQARIDDYFKTMARIDPPRYQAIMERLGPVLASARPENELTVGQYIDLFDVVHAIWAYSTTSKKITSGGRTVDAETAAREVSLAFKLASGEAKTGKKDGESVSATIAENSLDKLKSGATLLKRIVNVAYDIDHGDPTGAVHKYIVTPIKEAVYALRDTSVIFKRELKSALQDIEPDLKKYSEKIDAPELGGVVFTNGLRDVLGVLKHKGNKSNWTKMLVGWGWAKLDETTGEMDTSQWDAFEKRLQNDGILMVQHYEFLQKVWDLFGRAGKGAQATSKETTGFYFTEIPAKEFTAFGKTFAGGYVPASIDPLKAKSNPRIDSKNDLTEFEVFANPTTGSGFTKPRIEGFHDKLSISLDDIGSALDWHLRYAYIEPAVYGVRNLLRNKDVEEAIGGYNRHYISKLFMPWLATSAQQRITTPGFGNNFFSNTKRVGAAKMIGLNTFVTLQQAFGVGLGAMVTGLSSTGVGMVALADSFTKFLYGDVTDAEIIKEKSGFMRHRMQSALMDIREQIQKITLNKGKWTTAKDFVENTVHIPVVAMQAMVDRVVWVAAYNKYYSETHAGTTEEDIETNAIISADDAVSMTQGSFNPEEVARYEIGPAWYRLGTMFTGYFNAVGNLSVSQLKRYKYQFGFKRGAAIGNMAVGLGLMAGVIFLSAAITKVPAIQAGDDDDWNDRESFYSWALKVFGTSTMEYLFAAFPFFGNIARAGYGKLSTGEKWDDEVRISPAIDVLGTSLITIPKLGMAAMDEDKRSPKDIEDIMTGLGYLSGWPLGTKPTRYGLSVLLGESEPESIPEVLSGIARGR